MDRPSGASGAPDGLSAFFMTRVVNHISARLMGLAAALFCATPMVGHAQTISNVANFQWDAGGSRVSRPSNRLDIQVERPAPLPPSLVTFQLGRSPNSERFAVPTTQCHGSGGSITPVTLDGVFAGTPLSPAVLDRSTQIRAGEPLVVALTSQSDNQNGSLIETITVRLETPGGDSETLQLSESGENTGVFIGIVRTAATPPAPVRGDCVLSVQPGDNLILNGIRASDGAMIAASPVEVLIDPFGIVFDSADGTPIPGVRVTLIDVATGQPADVFGDDGVSRFPSSVVTGSTVTDSGGTVYAFPPGDYRFPFARAGTYRLRVEPPAPFTVPSTSNPASLANLRRPDGPPYTIVPGSYGAPFVLNDPAPVRIDIPADQPGGTLSITKAASSPVVVPGDALQYRITLRNGSATRATGPVTVSDMLPRELRLRANTVRIDSVLVAATIAPDGRQFSVALPPLAAGASRTLTYVAEVRPDARPGTAMNRASARDDRGAQSPVVDAAVRIARDGISDRMTIIGRITDGGCTVDPGAANGIAGVRVMLEDGSYTVTDVEGRYHFEGVIPGLHVVQMDASTLPSGQVPSDCAKNARSGGSAISRFVEGQGGALLRVDFRSTTGANSARPVAEQVKRAVPVSDPVAAGAERDWFADQTPEIKWLFPEPDHNPRTKAVRVAIKHLPNQTVTLLADGKPVSALAFDGARKNGLETMAVSIWRSIPLNERDTLLTAEVRDANGTLVETLKRTVHYANSALRAEFLPAQSILVADGVTRPVIAVRMTDRDGRPVHHGLVGDFEVPSPYSPAIEADAQAARQLSGLERAKPVWHVTGEDGIAYIELEPTTASGTLQITFPFRDADTTRTQRIQTWLTPGNRPWTIVGFAAGTVGFNTLDSRIEKLGEKGGHTYSDARLALYAKGRVKGKWLLTLAYDSDKEGDDTRFGGVIDPASYYTIYADRSERRYDAASVRKLYLRLERPQFYALFGDYETGINEPELTRYQRAFNGVKAEYGNDRVAATAFVADTPFRHVRQEIQGNGLTGPYALNSRDILPNSERVVIEVRDRIRSNRIIDSRVLVRNIDYDIDYIAGTLRFREPILSRTSSLDPQFIVADYDVDGVGARVTNAGGRATVSNKSKTLTVGGTAIHDETDRATTNMGGVDVRFTPNASTEIRAEIAVSDAKAKAGSGLTDTGRSLAWLVEAEHHGKSFDALAYARQQDAGFGVGQNNLSENGTRKYGVEGRIKVTPELSLVGSAFQEDYLNSDARRQAGRALVEYRGKALDLRAGLTIANDRLAGGDTARSTIAQFGATKKLFDNKLELDAQTELPIGGKDESIDFPARHKIGARLAVTNDVSLVAGYEIADGEKVDARTARVGFDIKPWAGGRFVASANQQQTNEFGPRSFAAYGLSQSLPVSTKVTVDFSLEGNKTLRGIDAARVLNTAQPVASGGFIGTDGVLTEDFTAVTTGATYRGEDWSVTGRAEYRDGSISNRYGLTAAALRQIGEGRAFGGALSYFRANQNGGPRTETTNIALSWANRPDDSRFAFLEKLELREDRVRGAVFGQAGPIGGPPLTVSGDVTSKRVINSFSLNWSPTSRKGSEYLGRSELSVFIGTRYVFDRFGEDDLKGLSNIIGADIRFDLGKHVDLGLSGTVRQNPGGRAISYSGGPSLSISPIKNSYITVGYNVVGFQDRDFQDSRYTRSGPYVTLRLKFDQDSFSSLGLGRK